ncbi:Dna glycosylase superfamily protein [Thalictrum thalictroides]|uniref:Dna glycosylase superfamily protein n=1 Tax=Thalictrum thalictroides TaxID=46969 RepID=A0A7J6WG37_THATH|nr:Dna glycosylase superfamily protein [Thalictrum thalictroides]
MVNLTSWSSSSDSSSSSSDFDSDSDLFTRWSLEYQASRNRNKLLMLEGLMMMLAYLIELEREEEEDDDDDEEEEEEERAHSLEMREVRSRKRNHSSFPNYYDKNKKKKKNPTEISSSNEPFPTHLQPTPEECRLVRDSLLSLHGVPKEFAKYRKVRSGLGISSNTCSETNQKEIEVVKEAQKESVLDGLVNTILSQNTTEVNSTRAFASLKSAFPTWEDVLAAELKCIEDAIRCGGLAVTKASCIKNLLTGLFEKKGKLCLEYLRDMSVDEIKAELSGFKGIGPKTTEMLISNCGAIVVWWKLLGKLQGNDYNICKILEVDCLNFIPLGDQYCKFRVNVHPSD